MGDSQSGATAYAGATATDAQGNVYVTGTFGGRLLFGSQQLSSRLSSLDVFVAKYDAVGNNLWAVSVGGDLTDYASELALDGSGNVYITGTYAAPVQFGTTTLPAPAGRADIYVAKLDPAGNWLWAVHGGGSDDDSGAALAVDTAGAAVLVGSFGGATATFGATQLGNPSAGPSARAGYIARLTPTGNWATASGMSGPGTTLSDVALDAAGNAYVCGSFDSASLAFGTLTLTNAGLSTTDTFVAKLTPAGNWQWATRGGGPGHDRAHALAVDGNGLVYVTGGFGGSAVFGATTLASHGPSFDIFVAALDAAGAWRWATQAGGSDGEAGSDLALDGAGRPVITGEFFSPTAQFGPIGLALSGTTGRSDAFLAKLTATGTWLWALGSSGPEDEIGEALALDIDGGMYLAGIYIGAGQFGGTTLPGTQSYRVFLTKVYDRGPLAIVTTLAPSSGAPGQAVTLTGTDFVGVTAVLFNGTPAASFVVQSATRLEAVVPVGVTAGPVSVRTGAGTGSSTTAFQPTILGTRAAVAGALQIYPNPATDWVQLPGLPVGTRVQLLDVLSRVVRTAVLVPNTPLSVRGLPPGLYVLRALDAHGRQHTGRLAVK